MPRSILSLVALLIALAAFGKSPFQGATLLEYAETEAGNAKRAYYCVEAHNPDRILIGHKPQRKPARNKPPVNTAVQVQYDDRELWIRQPGRGTVHLDQDYMTRAFPPNSTCEKIVENAWARLNAPPKTLHIRDESKSRLQ